MPVYAPLSSVSHLCTFSLRAQLLGKELDFGTSEVRAIFTSFIEFLASFAFISSDSVVSPLVTLLRARKTSSCCSSDSAFVSRSITSHRLATQSSSAYRHFSFSTTAKYQVPHRGIFAHRPVGLLTQFATICTFSLAR